MISKDFRFHGHGSLRFVYSKGTQVRQGQASLMYSQNKRAKNSRLAVVVSKKVSKIAPKRNRIRRRFYEELRQYIPKINSNYDIVLTIFDENLAVAPAEDISELVSSLLKKANIID